MLKYFISAMVLSCGLISCDDQKPSSDDIQQRQQEVLLQEGTAQIGMPAIKNFRERKMLKDIIELRDQSGFNTFTYLWSEVSGKKVFFCNSIGYGIPYATQFTSPQKVQRYAYSGAYHISSMPQADPNGLFSPQSADGTWVMCKDPKGTDVKPVFIEPKVIVSPFELPETEVESSNKTPTKK